MATRTTKNLYEVLGAREGRLAGGDQEGLPQARAAVPPGQEPGRQGGRGDVQGGAGRLRRPLRPGEAASSTTPGARRAAGPSSGPGGSFTFDFGDFGDLGDLLGGIFGGRRRRHAGAVSARPARPGRGGRAQPLVRGRAARRRDDDSRQPRVGVLDVQGLGSEARDAAQDVSRSAAAAASSPRRRGCSRSRSRARAAAGTAR